MKYHSDQGSQFELARKLSFTNWEENMSFEKARDIIDLYAKLSSRYVGLSINEVMTDYDVSKRTAQRMLHLSEDMFYAETYNDDEGRKRWRVRENIRKELIDVNSDELAAFDLAIDLMGKYGQKNQVHHLNKLKTKISALIPKRKSLSISTDLEALLEAQGYAAKRGPRPLINNDIFASISDALKGCQILRMKYTNYERILAPYAVLYGKRVYLVAHEKNSSIKEMKYYRLDRISNVSLTEDYFERDESFDLNEYTRKAYSVYQNDDEYSEVEWKFSAEIAEDAKSYLFHPDQQLIENDDGSLIVKFKASGHLEMCWDLYQWGDQVEVIKPERLKKLCEGYRRSDFFATP
tara:strand:- start:210716 stop:211765 length:1050 start_codon:yes stop_codon:yes gene_type:complete